MWSFLGCFHCPFLCPVRGNHFTPHKGQLSPCPAACGTGADVPISLRAEVVFPPRPCPSSENPDSLSALPLGVPRSPFLPAQGLGSTTLINNLLWGCPSRPSLCPWGAPTPRGQGQGTVAVFYPCPVPRVGFPLLLSVPARLRPSPLNLQPPRAPPGYLGAAPSACSEAAAERQQQRLLRVSLPLQIPVLRFSSSGAAASSCGVGPYPCTLLIPGPSLFLNPIPASPPYMDHPCS